MILLKDIILILFLAILIILILSKFRIPPVIGFLLTGVIIGPTALQLVDSISDIEVLAEIGIILLMFTIGLEFSLEKIRKIFKDFLLFGGLQVAISWLVFSFLLYWYGLVMHQALLGGFILALSSTAIVLKLLQEKDDLNSPSGLKMTGILLFQDAVIIPALILLPLISQFREAQTSPIVTKILLAFGSVILVFIVSKAVLPNIFKLIFKVRLPDLLLVTVFVFLFGLTILAHQLGLSMAMGAFIVGIAISDSDYAHQINTDIIPFRHIFNSIFFISIGMFVNISFLLSHFTQVLSITLIIIVIKFVIILAIFVVTKHPLNTGVMTAFGLAHIGEFSFILLKVAQENTLFDQDIHQILLSSAILSMFSIPLALNIGKKISRSERLKKGLQISEQSKPLTNHTIIAGFGVNGQNIAKILKLLDFPYTIIEMNPATVKKYKSLGESIHFGNIDREQNMKLIGISKASLLVIAINDMEATRRTVKLARRLNSSLRIIVRANYITQVETMYKFGADLVLSQDMETSLIFIHHILKFYHMPDHITRIQTNLLRKKHYQFFYKQETREEWKIAISDNIEQDNELFFISPHSRFVDKKLESLDPFHYDGTEIIGVIRKTEVLSKPLGNLIIEKYDTIIFSGNHQKVFEAMTWMEENN
ncbi:cation:proton antiporter [candidate division KSB1 bacterium]|nr:cation:proton antiporter [candidate division KSB1 bacterium]